MQFMNKWACPLILAFSIILTPGFSQTITTGEITGTVLDASGALVVGATVVLRSVDTGESRPVQSNASGAYRFTFVKPASYELSGTSAGLKSDIGSLIASVGQVQVLDLHLKPEEAKEVVLVTEAAPLLDTDNANVVYTLSTRQLELLPLPGGDLVSVAYSVPGVVLNNRFGQGNFVLQGVGSASNLFTVNGTDNMDPYKNVNNSGTTGLLLGVNEVQEASIIQNAYEGQYGRQAGSQFNYVTKSGTNAYHGNLLYNYNGTRMNANDFFRNALGTPRPHQVSNQYAASLGGHVVKDKLFFFADTEGLRFSLPGNASVVAVPSAALENYSLRTIQASQVSLYQKMFDLYNHAPGHERAVPVTSGTGLLRDNSGRLGCGRLAGTPTGAGGTFGVDVSCAEAWGTNITRQTSEWLLATRADYNLSANQRVFFRFKTDHGSLPVATSAISPVFNTQSIQPDYEGQLNHTLVITPRLVNNFIGAVTYNSYVTSVADLPAALKAFPFRINLTDGGANGATIASIGAPASVPTGRRAGLFQLIDDISYSVGSHSLKAGINYRYNRETDLAYAGFVYGRFNISRLDEFATGMLSGTSNSTYTANFTANPSLYVRLYNIGIYLQDQWAVTRQLKVTATVRFDRTGNPYCQNRCFTRLISAFPDLNKGLSIPYNQSIQTGLSHAFYDIEPIVPQPRLSLVYTPPWSHGTVFRGGVGLFSDLYPAQFAGLMGGNAPNVFGTVFRNGLVNTGGTGSAPAIAAASANAFQSQFAAGATLQQLQRAVAPASFAPPAYYSLPSTVRNPKYLEWSLEVQHQFGAKNALTLRYMGNHGYDIFVTNPNANASADPAVYPNGFIGLPLATPDPRFGFVSQLTNNGYSNYNALTTVFRRAFSHGFQGQISYTWSHALDTLSNGGISYFSADSLTGQINPLNLRSLNYSNADYDVRHNITADFTWEGPVKFKNGLMNAVFSGWSAGSRLFAHTGTPFSVSNSGISGLSTFGGTVLADVLDPKIRTTCGASAVDTPCFTTGQFTQAEAQADLGNLPRNSFSGPGLFDIDSSLYKTVPVGERMRFAFGASAYNLLNHPNFFDPNADLASSGLGLIRSTGGVPSSPYGSFGGPAGRTLLVTGKFRF